MRDAPLNDQTKGAWVGLCTLGVFAVATLLGAPAAAQDNGCATGANALGNAYVRANPIYALYFGELEPYVTSQRGHFAPAADAIRCARVLSGALVRGAILSYDSRDFERQEVLNTQLESMGIPRGTTQPSASTQLLMMARTFGWLARVLPAASGGDFRPMYTATDEEEQLGLFLRRLLVTLLQEPMAQGSLQQAEPIIRELAEIEYRTVVGWAGQLAR